MALQSLLPALSWSSLYSLATLPLLNASSLYKFYKFFSFFKTSRSILFLWNLGKPRPCSFFFFFKKRPWKKKDFIYLFASLLMHLISMIQRRWRRGGPGMILIAKMAWSLLSDICASCNVTLWNRPCSPWIGNGFVTCLDLMLVWGWGLKNSHGPQLALSESLYCSENKPRRACWKMGKQEEGKRRCPSRVISDQPSS